MNKVLLYVKKIYRYILRNVKKHIIHVSIPAYKNISLEEKQEFYENEIRKIVNGAEKYKQNAFQDFEFTSPKEELKHYHKICSALDTLGDILIKIENGKKLVYRGISPNKIDFFKELYECGVLQSLAETGHFVFIKPINYYTEEYPLIIEIETLSIVPSYCWTFSMIRESAINMIITNTVLKQFGYAFQDGHTSNMAFKNYNPVFFDVGSVVKSRKDLYKEEFISYYLNTLLMLSIKKSCFAKWCISYYRSLTLPEPVNMNESVEIQTIRKIFFEFHARNSSQEYNIIMDKVFKNKDIRAEYVSILFEKYPYENTLWGDYSKQFFEQQKPDERRQRIIELIQKFSPDAKSCLDIAGNSGYFSLLLAKTKRFDSLITVDYDENAVEYGREYLKNEAINFYLINPFRPFGEKEIITSAIQSDVVLALAVSHHLILTQGYNIDFIFSTVSMYTRKYVYIEFCPLGLYGGGDTLPEVPSWYTKEWFEECFKRYFNLLYKEVVGTIIVKHKELDHRILYIGEKLIC